MSNRTLISGFLALVLMGSGTYAIKTSDGPPHVASSHIAGNPPPSSLPLSPSPIAMPSSPQRTISVSPTNSGVTSTFQQCIQTTCVHLPAFSTEFNNCVRECFASGTSSVSRPALPPQPPEPPPPPSPLPSIVGTEQHSSVPPVELTSGAYCISPSNEQTTDRIRCDTPLRQGAFLFPILASKPYIPVDRRIVERLAVRSAAPTAVIEDIVATAVKQMAEARGELPEGSIAAITLRETMQSLQEILRIHGPSNAWSSSTSDLLRRDIALQLRLANQTLQLDSIPTRAIGEFVAALGTIFQRLPAFLKTITETQIVTGASAERIFGEYYVAREDLLNARSRCASDPDSDVCVLAIWSSIESLSAMRWVEPLYLANTDAASEIGALFDKIEDEWGVKTSEQKTSKPRMPYLE